MANDCKILWHKIKKWAFVISDSFYGAGIWVPLYWLILIQGFWWSHIHDWVGAAFLGRLTKTQGSASKVTHLHGWRVGAGCWWEARFLSSLPCGLLHKAAWVSSQHGSQLPSDVRKSQPATAMPFRTQPPQKVFPNTSTTLTDDTHQP